MSDTGYAEPDGPNFDIVALVLVILVAILFLIFAVKKAYAEPDPCAITAKVVTKTQWEIFQSATAAKVFAVEHNGEMYIDKDHTQYAVKYIETWAVSNGEGCWEDK